MIQITVPAALRSSFGKGASRQLRMKEFTPGIVYSGGAEALPLQFESASLYKTLFAVHGRNAVVTLKIEGDDKGDRHVLVKEIQKNPVTDSLVHVDFHEIDLEKPALFSVPIKYVGTPKGVDLGGELQTMRKMVKVKGVPLDIPDFVEAGIANLNRGDSLTIGDLIFPDTVEVLDKAKTVIVAVN